MRTAIDQDRPGLRTVHLEGDDYFIDLRLREFRTVTPPIRCIEFIGFASEKGRRMLKQCVMLEWGRCGHLAVLPRDLPGRDCVECGVSVG
ncbi:MAG: hypothetical protein IH988_07350 [Planctomycetes bacterium]|nr:hypothetical protein [Planctomycetota bacterium]